MKGFQANLIASCELLHMEGIAKITLDAHSKLALPHALLNPNSRQRLISPSCAGSAASSVERRQDSI